MDNWWPVKATADIATCHLRSLASELRRNFSFLRFGTLTEGVV